MFYKQPQYKAREVIRMFALLFHLSKLRNRYMKNKITTLLYSIFMYGHFPSNILLQYIQFKDLYRLLLLFE